MLTKHFCIQHESNICFWIPVNMIVTWGLYNNPPLMRQLLFFFGHLQRHLIWRRFVSFAGFWACCFVHGSFSTVLFLNIYHVVSLSLFQEEPAVLLIAHTHANSIRHPEADALLDPSHSENSKTSASLSLSLSVIRSLCGSLTICLFLCFLPLNVSLSTALLFAITVKRVSHLWTHLLSSLF